MNWSAYRPGALMWLWVGPSELPRGAFSHPRLEAGECHPFRLKRPDDPNFANAVRSGLGNLVRQLVRRQWQDDCWRERALELYVPRGSG